MEYIYEVHDIVPRALCEEIIEKFENDPDKKTGGVGVGKTVVVEEVKKTVDLTIADKPGWESVYDQLEHLLATGIYRYFEYLFHSFTCKVVGALFTSFQNQVPCTGYF